MTGLEKIIKKIEADSNAECEVILSAANAEAGAILKKAAEDAELIKERAMEAAIKENEKDKTFISSKAELDLKKGLLAEKVAIVNSVIDSALKKLRALPDEEYFKTLSPLVLKYAQNGSGTLRFSSADLKRIPSGFKEDLNKALGDSRSVTISSEPVDIDGGFVLVYENIEQNCSFSSLLATKTDEIKDELYALLFKRYSL